LRRSGFFWTFTQAGRVTTVWSISQNVRAGMIDKPPPHWPPRSLFLQGFPGAPIRISNCTRWLPTEPPGASPWPAATTPAPLVFSYDFLETRREGKPGHPDHLQNARIQVWTGAITGDGFISGAVLAANAGDSWQPFLRTDHLRSFSAFLPGEL